MKRCPTLKELPSAPAGKVGWPWTEGSNQLDERMADGAPWPKISIVTPNYNYGHFLEETIRSVLLQGYPNLQYIVRDAGSQDHSVSVIKRYARWIDYWVSERDNGQSDAINKGFRSCNGEIFNWLNSDDHLMPNALGEIAGSWRKWEPDFLFGASIQVDHDSREILSRWEPRVPKSPWNLISKRSYGLGLAQPSGFMRSCVFDRLGLLDDRLQCAMDLELYLRYILAYGRRSRFVAIAPVVSRALVHPEAKTAGDFYEVCVKEWANVLRNLKCDPRTRTLIRWMIRRQAMRAAVDAARAENCTIMELVALLGRYPEGIFSRYYLGAVRQLLRRRVVSR